MKMEFNRKTKSFVAVFFSLKYPWTFTDIPTLQDSHSRIPWHPTPQINQSKMMQKHPLKAIIEPKKGHLCLPIESTRLKINIYRTKNANLELLTRISVSLGFQNWEFIQTVQSILSEFQTNDGRFGCHLWKQRIYRVYHMYMREPMT